MSLYLISHFRKNCPSLISRNFSFSLQKWIEEHKQDYRGNRTGDLTDAYLAKIAENAPSFTEKGLGAMLREMFVIGAESESVMMRWSLRLFSVFKEVQDKVQAEIDSLKGTKKKSFFFRNSIFLTFSTFF